MLLIYKCGCDNNCRGKPDESREHKGIGLSGRYRMTAGLPCTNSLLCFHQTAQRLILEIQMIPFQIGVSLDLSEPLISSISSTTKIGFLIEEFRQYKTMFPVFP
jgi:hypothetical protein